MEIVEVKVFKFEELSDKAKAIAIAKHRDVSELHQDGFNDDAALQIEEAGFEEAELSYSLSNCQGDGLSFKAKRYAKLKELFIEVLGAGKEKTASLLADNMTQVLKGNNGHYCYASKSDIDIYCAYKVNPIRIDEVVAKVLAKLEDLYVELCGKLEKQGYADFEGQKTDEFIAEEIIANEYEFTESGKRFDH